MRTAILSSLLTVLLLGGLLVALQLFGARHGGKGAVRRHGDFLDLTVRVPVPWLFSGKSPAPTKQVYLNREGARLRGGGDDATSNRASLAGSSADRQIVVPAFRGSYYRWTQVLKCVRKAFAPFDVEILDQRPVDQNYVMVMLGGRPRLLNRKGTAHLKATGLAPFNGLPIQNAVAIIFTRKIGPSVRRLCETVAHEIGHVYGLDHSYDCRDFMTYLPYCATRRFLNKAVPCGERKKRACQGGKPTQNSYAELARVLGLRKKTK